MLAKASLTVDGVTQLNTIANATTDTDKFLVSDGGIVKYRTGAEVLSDIGAAMASGYIPYIGASANVDLGTFDLTADVITGATGSFASNGGSDTFAINHSSGSGIALNITKGGNGEGLYINKTSGSGNAATIIGTLNATTLVKSGGTSSQYLMADGSVSTLTNPVTGTGTTNYLPKFTGASTIGNSNITDTGSLITLGSNSYVNGAMGIGQSTLTGYNLRIGTNITGATTSYGIYNSSSIQSDVTTTAIYNRTVATTQAASFTLTNLYHYFASQGTIGIGSTVTNQFGFRVDDSLVGATNNYGFYGNIASGTNRWNLYMNGTANNYIAGNLGIGNTSLDTSMLRISRAFTSTLATSIFLDSQVSSTNTSANYISTSANTQAATFTTQIRHISLSQGTFGAGSTVTSQFGIIVGDLTGATNNYGFFGNISAATNRWNLYMGGTAANYMAGVLNIGTTTLSGFTLDVNGTGRFSGALSANSFIPTSSSVPTNGMYLSAANTLNFATASTNRLTIASTGNIGIGTSAPDELLTLSANIPVLRLASTNVSGKSYQFFSNSDGNFYLRNASTSTNLMVVTNSNNVLIGTTTDVASSILTVTSTTKGFLPPRMTATQRAAIASPAEGLIVVQTDGTQGLYLYIGAAWHAITML
jgi:hypothetical protein